MLSKVVHAKAAEGLASASNKKPKSQIVQQSVCRTDLLRTVESMNKAYYRMLAWLCIIAGNFLALCGFVTDVWLTNTISRGGLSDRSAFSSIYTYSSVLVFGGIILIVIGIGFIWRARHQPNTTSAI